MGACQIIIIILHLLITPLNKNCLSFLIAVLLCFFVVVFFPHLNVLLLLLIIILTATLKIWYSYLLCLYAVLLCVTVVK